jgi:hypothetical protein
VTRRLLVLVALVALGAAGTACDLSPPAATVGTTTITRSQLDDQLALIAGNTDAQCALQLQGVNLAGPLTGAGDRTVTTSFATFELSTLVVQRLVDQDLARRGHPVTTANLQAARQDLVAQLTPTNASSPCGLSGPSLLARLPKDFLDEQVQFLAAQEQLASVVGHVDVSHGALVRYYDTHPTQFQEVCLSAIAVQTQAQAQQIHDAIAGGHATFENEAMQFSIDTQSAQSGGRIGCVPSAQIVNSVILDAISGLSSGQLSQAVFEPQTGSNGAGIWVVLRVDGRPIVPFAQAESQIRQQLLSSQNSAVSAEFTKLTRRAHVVVDPRYGSWAGVAGVRAPLAPKPSYLLSPSADQGPAPAGPGTLAG